MNFCSKCGSKLDDDSQFCSNCGNKIETENTGNTGNTEKSNQKTSIDSSKFINILLSNHKLIILGIAIIALICIIPFSGVFGNDMVDVTSISMSVSYSDTPFGGAVESANVAKQDYAQKLQYLKQNNPEQYKLELQLSGMTEDEWPKYLNAGSINHRDSQVGKAITKFSLMPKETITRVTGLKLANVEVSLDGGKTENWGTFTFETKDAYIKDMNYDFSISKILGEKGENIDEYYKITHIKGDIVINTTEKTNLVIGHLNEDVKPTHY